MKFYLAYGMNTNLGSMMYRSPASKSLGKVTLADHAFKFKHHADAEYLPGASMECAIWSITDDCERSLDNLEGYPYYYEKKMVPVEFQGKIVEAMIYYMVSDYKTPSRPSQNYYDMVLQGYHQHGMDTNILHRAYEETLDIDIIDISAYN
jgi:gamma-glutamylcyclotransferase (GGCT)/AIG2-like uncharacterized protein YtfP